MKIEVSYLNATERYRIHDEVIDVADLYIGDDPSVGDIFKELRSQFGRCTGKVYVDRHAEGDPPGTFSKHVHVGWVFVKRLPYDDTRYDEKPTYYIQEVWASLLDRDETIRYKDYHAI